MGSQGSPFKLTLDLGAADPNSGNTFWNKQHQWLIAEDPTGFENVWYQYNFPTFVQGSFSVSADSQFDSLFISYAPIPEPASIGLWAAGAAVIGLRRRRNRNPARSDHCGVNVTVPVS